ncbi:hypothetical protein [Tardiphaga robiniae]|uniref:Uncharacterized protein n=1 Tax=Tardiphaga robiniae TaxID=943830 RepID=A0A7G6TUG6_9BRAD|nr:hypothetical protein [Tardiphaga robiniae]QND70398.1 hypothetical protein HB776_03425 [Tardiphaga robiniae]
MDEFDRKGRRRMFAEYDRLAAASGVIMSSGVRSELMLYASPAIIGFVRSITTGSKSTACSRRWLRLWLLLRHLPIASAAWSRLSDRGVEKLKRSD